MRARGTLRTVAIALLGALLSAGALSAGPAAADASSATGDESVSAPTGWWAYSGVGESAVTSALTANNARLVSLDYNPSANTFAVAMVRNTGAYAAVGGWWWYYGKTAAELSALITTNGARLIDLQAYPTVSGLRFAAIMVKNAGAANRAWWWYYGKTAPELPALLSANSARLVSVRSYLDGTTTRYAVVMVANTGADSKSWQWWYGVPPGEIATKIAAFGGRLVELDRQPSGNYTIVMVANSGDDNKNWRHYRGLTSITQVINVANQFGQRVFDLRRYSTAGGTRFDALMVDSLPAETRRVANVMLPTFTQANGLTNGWSGFYLKQVGKSPTHAMNARLRYEPASAIKALHNLRLMREVQLGRAKITDNYFYYNYPNTPSSPSTLRKDVCPVASDEIPANRVVAQLGWLQSQMMSVSDNRTTRSFTIRYGLSGLQSLANTAGMGDTTIGQAFVGCGVKGGRNLTTLVDLGKLYEGVEDGTLLTNANGAREQFYQPMNGGTVGTGNPVAAMISEEAAAAGKSGKASSFRTLVTFRIKGGSYNIGCGDITPGCDSSQFYYAYRDFAGIIRIPFKSGGSIVSRTFVWGRYFADLKRPWGSDVASYDTTMSTVDAEMLRSTVRAAIATW